MEADVQLSLLSESINEEDFPRGPGIYVITHILPGGVRRRYAGQGKDLHRRVTRSHCNPRYRIANPSLNYSFWEAAEDGCFLAPVLEPSLLSGPLMNLLEQWMSIVFRGLQPHQLQENLPAHTYEMLSDEERETGAGLAEPFSQGISFRHWSVVQCIIQAVLILIPK